MRGRTHERLYLFQLHHTGIKTSGCQSGGIFPADFNCTIQELKHVFGWNYWTSVLNFNCTIQELKHFFSFIIY